MKELIKKTDDLIVKIHRLMDKQDRLVAELLVKDEKLRELNTQLKERTDRVRQLEEQIALQKTTGRIIGTDSKEARRILNEYIREIDRCIEKLSAEG